MFFFGFSALNDSSSSSNIVSIVIVVEVLVLC